MTLSGWTSLAARLVAILVTAALAVTGCGAAEPSTPDSVSFSGDGSVEHAGFTATSPVPDQVVTLAPPALGQDGSTP